MKRDTAEVLSIDGREVRVTNPDKPYFSKQTKLSKLDLVRYYLSWGAWCQGELGVRFSYCVIGRARN